MHRPASAREGTMSKRTSGAWQFALSLTVSALALAFTRGAEAQANGARTPADNSAIELLIGEQRVLPAHGVKTYSEGVRGIIDVRLTSDASRFVIVGVARGTTTLLLIMTDGSERLMTITVKDPRE